MSSEKIKRQKIKETKIKQKNQTENLENGIHRYSAVLVGNNIIFNEHGGAD